jgi:serine/threonine protein kinase
VTAERHRKVRALFDEAVRRPVEQRAEFLREASGEDAALLEELTALVDAYREDDAFLEPGSAFNRSGFPADAVRNDPLAVGEQLAHYVIRKEIGRGGMGVVYLAEDTRLGRPVALKALSPRLLADPRQIARFRREARAAASLRHPAIATVYALEERDGQFYLISEYLPGGRLGEEILRGGLGVRESVSLVRRVAEGLAEAHAHGVVHRDLKPDNIIRDETGRPKLVDFGLALVSKDTPPDRSNPGAPAENLTLSGFMLGTPGYISPEQLDGRPADARSDQFALGVLMIELVTGRNPFLGENVARTVAATLGNDPEIPGEMPPSVARIVRRCIEKDPERRYASTGELAAELREAERAFGTAVADTGPSGQRADANSAAALHEPPVTDKDPEDGRLHAGWWTFHQAAVLCLYGVMIAVGWNVLEEAGTGRDWPARAIFFGILSGGIGAGTLRTHLLFTSRFNARAMAEQLHRTRTWLVSADTLFSSALALGALRTMGADPLAASALVAVAVGYAIVFFFVEPSTTRAIFPPL